MWYNTRMKNDENNGINRENITEAFKRTVNTEPEWLGTHGLQCKIGKFTLSLQWHLGAYSDNREFGTSVAMYDVDLCDNFEIGLWETETKRWVPCSKYDDVAGWVPWERLTQILSVVARPDLHGALPYVCV